MTRYGNDEYVDLKNAVVLRSTAKAKLVRFNGEEHWIPVSQIKQNHRDCLRISKWIADQKGITIGASIKAVDGHDEPEDDWNPIDDGRDDGDCYPDQLGIDDY